MARAAMKRRTLTYALYALLAAPALWAFALLAWTIAHRFGYPFDLEWMEGGLLTHALRYTEGRDIYVRPSVDFIPYLYTPLYPLLMAGLSKLSALSYQLGRLISIVSLVGIVALVIVAVAQGTTARRRPVVVGAAVAASGLFAVTYPYVEGWYDLVRADTFFIFLGLLGLVLLRRWAPVPGTRLKGFWHGRVALCGVVLALSFFAKQTGVLLVLAGGVALLALNWRAVPAYGIAAGLVGGGGTLLYQWISDGWFWLYAYGYFHQHSKDTERFFYAFRHILLRYPSMTLLVALGLLAVAVRRLIRRRPLTPAGVSLLYWSWVFVCGLLIGALSWAHQWAHFNGYIPAFLFGTVCAGLALVVLADAAAGLRRGAPAVVGAGAVVLLFAGVGVDTVRHYWKPEKLIPTAADRAAGERLLWRIAATEGDVFIPFHPWYGVLAGKPSTVHRMGIWDVMYRPHPSTDKKPLPPEATRVNGLAEALRDQRFAAIIMDRKVQLHRYPGIRSHYRKAHTLGRNEAPRTYTGASTKPHTVWVPKNRVSP